MESFIVFHAPTGDSDLPHGIYRLREGTDFPSAQCLARCEFTSDAITICKWLNERPTKAWAKILDEFEHVNFELLRAGNKIRCEARRPNSVKIVLGRSAFGDRNLYNRIIICDDDLIEADNLFRSLVKHAWSDAVFTYWQFDGEYTERVLD